MSLATTTSLTGSLAVLMTNLVALEEHVNDGVRVFKWRPRVPDPPCIWNWLDMSPWEQRDTGRQRDTFRVIAVLAIRHTDSQIEMDQLTGYIDDFRDVVDRALYTHAPLGAKFGRRLGVRMAVQQFGENQYLSAEFPMEFQLDREISAT